MVPDEAEDVSDGSLGGNGGRRGGTACWCEVVEVLVAAVEGVALGRPEVGGPDGRCTGG